MIEVVYQTGLAITLIAIIFTVVIIFGDLL